MQGEAPTSGGLRIMRFSQSQSRPSRLARLLYRSVLALIIGSAAIPSYAADLIITCVVKQTDPSGSQYTFRRHYEIVFEVTHADIYDDHGSGWRRIYNGNFLKADDSRIIITQTEGEYHEINRNTGDVYDKITSGSIYAGSCEKSERLTQKF
jgi:hypothetical protein